KLRVNVNIVAPHSLYKMTQICKDLSELVIDKCYRDIPELISLVDAQRNLKSVAIVPDKGRKGTCNELGKALARKEHISDFRLYSVSIIPPSFLTSLINLKCIVIFRKNYSPGEVCYYRSNYEDTGKEIEEFQRYLTIFEFPDLEKIIVEGLSCFKELAMLIEKTKGNISYI